VPSIAPRYAYTTGGSGCYYRDQSDRPADKNPCGVIIGGPGLKPETSTSYEASVLWDNQDGLRLGATYFYTDFKDKITNAREYDANGDYVLWSEDPYYTVFYNYNIDNAVIQGVELTANWEATDSLTFRGSYTYTHSEQKTGEYAGLPLARTPKHMASLRADWITPVDGLTTWAAANYHG